eukprot:4799381-Pleurochrysis_carterae.AAC.2
MAFSPATGQSSRSGGGGGSSGDGLDDATAAALAALEAEEIAAVAALQLQFQKRRDDLQAQLDASLLSAADVQQSKAGGICRTEALGGPISLDASFQHANVQPDSVSSSMAAMKAQPSTALGTDDCEQLRDKQPAATNSIAHVDPANSHGSAALSQAPSGPGTKVVNGTPEGAEMQARRKMPPQQKCLNMLKFL